MEGTWICFSILLTSHVNGNYFKQDDNFDNMLLLDSSLYEEYSIRLLLCAFHCHVHDACLSFVHTSHNGRCQLFSRLFFSQLADVTQTGNVMFKKTDGEVVCAIPDSIPKGRLLNVDGQKEGSKASFACDDFYFPTILHGVCGTDGIWDGFTSPCVNVPSPPYSFLTVGRVSPGRCVVLPAIAPSQDTLSKINFLNSATTTTLLSVNFQFTAEVIERNSKIDGIWGTTESSLPFWPLALGQNVNLTICTEDTQFRMYIDHGEVFTYNHRLTPSDVARIKVYGFILKGIFFTE